MQTRMVENGASNYRRKRIGHTWTRCGYTLWVSYSPLQTKAHYTHPLYQMLAAIGETFDPILTLPHPANGPSPQGLITGVILSARPQFFRISIWTRLASPSTNTAGEEEELRKRIEAIGRHFKTQVLGYAETQKLGGPLATEVEFLSHKDSEKKGRGKKIVV